MRSWAEGRRFSGICGWLLTLGAVAGCSGRFSTCRDTGTCDARLVVGTGGAGGEATGGETSAETDGAGIDVAPGAGGTHAEAGAVPSDPGDGGLADASSPTTADSGTDAGAPGADAGAGCDAADSRPPTCDETHADCNHDPTDGCEVDLTSDRDHCGACDQDCLGGSCTLARCDPVTLASSLVYPAGLAIDTDRLYFMDGIVPVGRLHRSRLDGGTSEVLVSGLAIPTGVLLDGGYAYFAATGAASITLMGTGVRRIPVGAPPTQTPEEVATLGTSAELTAVNTFAVGGGRVYWTNEKGTLYSAPENGGPPSVVGTPPVDGSQPTDIALDDAFAYVAEGADYWVAPLGGGPSRSVHLAGGSSTALALDDAYVYFRTQSLASEHAAIGRLAKTGTDPNDIAIVSIEDAKDGALAVDDAFVYFPTKTGIYRAPKSGGPAERLASADGTIAELTLHVEGGRKVLYWLNRGLPASATGSVLRLAL
ncbi:MAG TPA: hypothetical protein VHE30_21480 [Polyangiaceae bacterium]|nr:hypothetical protein [Polyangiaceae bacterium]